MYHWSQRYLPNSTSLANFWVTAQLFFFSENNLKSFWAWSFEKQKLKSKVETFINLLSDNLYGQKMNVSFCSILSGDFTQNFDRRNLEDEYLFNEITAGFLYSWYYLVKNKRTVSNSRKNKTYTYNGKQESILTCNTLTNIRF